MNFLTKIRTLAKPDDEEPMFFNLTDIMLMDPDFKWLKTQISSLLHNLSHKYNLRDEQIVEIAIDSLKNPHKIDF